MKVLVTGGAGFIGTNFVRTLLTDRPEWHVTVLDLLTYAGNLGNIQDLIDDGRIAFLKGDVADGPWLAENLKSPFDLVVNFAAESHVDRSIVDATDFVRTNASGVQALLDVTRKLGGGRFLQVSTDEVYGSISPPARFTEASPVAPTSPYAASKAAGDLIALAAHKTHGQDVLVTRCSNNYGPYQFPEKLIPLMILSALANDRLPVYGDGQNVRDWIHVRDHCRALLLVAERGRSGTVYNVGADGERKNIDVVRTILATVDKPDELIQYVEDRPAHDRRYAIDAALVRRELGWEPGISFTEGLAETIEWYRDHPEWAEQVKSGAYRSFFERWYGERLASDEGPRPS